VIGEYLAWLAQYAEARMTGSGACVFAEFTSRELAEAAFAARPRGYAGCVTRGLPVHPLRTLALSV
jgi:4-diphosphocytidyl-2-C-methyl-D-erythritol kinase